MHVTVAQSASLGNRITSWSAFTAQARSYEADDDAAEEHRGAYDEPVLIIAPSETRVFVKSST